MKYCSNCERPILFKKDCIAGLFCSVCFETLPIEEQRSLIEPKPKSQPIPRQIVSPERVEIHLMWQPGVSFRDLTLQVLNQILDAFHGNKSRASLALDVSVRTIRNRLNLNGAIEDLSA